MINPEYIKYIAYSIGILATWLICDGIISIRIYLNTVDETGKRIQNWRYDHSIRLIRILIGMTLLVFGWVLL